MNNSPQGDSEDQPEHGSPVTEMSVRGWKESPLNRSSVCRIFYDRPGFCFGWNATRSALATTSMALLLAKCREFECLSAGFDHIMRQPCHTEHVNQYICLLR